MTKQDTLPPLPDSEIERLMKETKTEGYPEDVRRLVHAVQALAAQAPQPEQELDSDSEYAVTIDRRDLFDAIHAAYFEGRIDDDADVADTHGEAHHYACKAVSSLLGAPQQAHSQKLIALAEALESERRHAEHYSSRAARALRAAAAQAPQHAPICEACKGSGEGGSYHVPGTESDFVEGPCRECEGSGEAPQQTQGVAEHTLKDQRCECCGYMTYHREHMGCIRAAAPQAAPAPGFLPTKEHIRELAQEAADQVMEQAQVFASSWALVGCCLDSGNVVEDAEEAKTKLRTLVRSLADLAAESVRPAPAPDQEKSKAHAYVKQQVAKDMQAFYEAFGTEAAPAPEPPALTDADMLDFISEHRVAVIPEFEGGWDAEVYGEEETAEHIHSGASPREAIRAAMQFGAASAGGEG